MILIYYEGLVSFFIKEGENIKYDYIKQYEILHKEKRHYGMTSIKFYELIEEMIEKHHIRSILDYGCGKSILLDELKKGHTIAIYKYDPAIKEYSKKPEGKFDLVICTDVLQHIPLFDLDRVLNDIKKYSNNIFFHIRCTSYKTLLPNGEPANCTIYPKEWWMKELNKYFEKINIIEFDDDTISFITGGNYV